MKSDAVSICLLGSSHSACMYKAWKERTFPVAGGVTLTFFAGPSLSLNQLELDGRSLVPGNDSLAQKMHLTSGGKTRIDLDDYDAFVTIALGFKISVTDFMSDYGTFDNPAYSEAAKLLSRKCLLEVVKMSINDASFLRLADKIRSVVSPPILNVPAPFPCESALDEPQFRNRTKLRDTEFLQRTISSWQRVAEACSAAHGGEVLWPPADLLASPSFTKQAFAQGGLTLKEKIMKDPADREDGKHMNEDYGYHMLNAVFSKLDTMTGGKILDRSRSKAAQPAG